MSAVIVDIAKAVMTELDAGEFSMEFTPERAYSVRKPLEGAGTLKVLVAHRGYDGEPLNKSTSTNEYQIDIGIIQHPANVAVATLDALMALVEGIVDFFKMRHLTEYTSALCLKWENSRPYEPDVLEEKRTFLSIVTLTFQVLR